MASIHPAAPKVGQVLVSERIVGTINRKVKDRGAADIAGAGYITGIEFTGGAADQFTLKDTNGAGQVLLDATHGVVGKADDFLPATAWIPFSDGFHVQSSAGATSIVFRYRLIG